MSELAKEQVAIIRDVHIGCYDPGEPVLWFTTHVSESSASLQIIAWVEAYNVLKQVRDIRDLEGRPCWVEVDEPHRTIRFLRLWKEA